MLAGGNWNNGTNYGVSYRNANNVTSNSNRNNSSQLELGRAKSRTAPIPEPKGRTHSYSRCGVSTCSGKFGASTRLSMRRHGDLYRQICDSANLVLAHLKARRGKSHYSEVQLVNQDPDNYLGNIRSMLIDKTYETSPYRIKQVYEPKKRIIYKLPYYPDRIVHHAIMNVLQPIWDKIFIDDVYSAIPGRGLHAGILRLREFLRDKDGTAFCLKFDISSFYPSVNHNILLGIIKRKIKCEDTLWLLEEIGSYLKDELQLTINPKSRVTPVDSTGIDFLGYRIYRTHVLLRKQSARRFKSKIRYLEKNYAALSPQTIISVIASYMGWIGFCNGYNLQKKFIINNDTIQSILSRARRDLSDR